MFWTPFHPIFLTQALPLTSSDGLQRLPKLEGGLLFSFGHSGSSFTTLLLKILTEVEFRPYYRLGQFFKEVNGFTLIKLCLWVIKSPRKERLLLVPFDGQRNRGLRRLRNFTRFGKQQVIELELQDSSNS